MTQTDKQDEAATLYSAMALAFAEIEGATKAKQGQVGQQKYKYADLGSVIEAIKPALIKHGLFFTQCPEPWEGGVCITTHLYHTSGYNLPLGKLFVPANQYNAQGFGSALTYARRYALVTAFGVPVEDDDGSAASRRDVSHETKPERKAIDPDAFINDAARDKLAMLIEASGSDIAAFCRTNNLMTLKELTNARATELAGELKKAAA